MTKFPTAQELEATHHRESKLRNIDDIEIEIQTWDKYFRKSELVNINNDQFQIYTIPQTNDLDKPLTFICHHGAGHSALSFALMAKALHDMLKGACTVLSYDARGHGSTKTNEPGNLSLNQLRKDLENIIEKSVPSGEIILVGHSMGGAVAASAASVNKGQIKGKSIAGLVVIDVVEGTALAALSSMSMILDSRPKSFKSIEEGIKWSLKSSNLKNMDSAIVSIPPQLIEKDDKFVWRIDLADSQPFWYDWFSGLSQKFLNASAPKLLILAGTDRLDKELIIGQMQGKFQLEVRPFTSHVVQEDDPEGVANLLANFAIRYHRPIPHSFPKA
ncbi:protein phosphatase methylesterase [Neoconidiobolus thromboides FSU 785]|nr:protein phosphatase methylesterase [Neoconidiobolus thromboides FSU 785]